MGETDLITNILFYIFACLLILSAILSIFSKKVLYSILWAVSVFVCTSGLFYLLGSEYNSIVQFMIYCTAVPVILAFAVMFTDYFRDKKIYLTRGKRLYISFLAVGICISLIVFILNLTEGDFSYVFDSPVIIDGIKNLTSITKDIFLKYMYAFEMIALLVLIIAAGVSNHDE